ncbi:MAG: transglycosylase SLT domain-containing protein, partial [Guyparkeria sp.]
MPEGEIDLFMRAIASIESGGASNPVNVRNERTGAHGLFQIMPENWAPWAQEAGLGPNAPRTEENQRKVARHKMLSYYDQFGSW